MIREETQLVLGRGEVYFEPFLDGTRIGDGERYIGNTTAFQLSRTVNRLERFTAYKGQQVEREGCVLSETHSIQFITDNISIENVGLWFGEETSETTFPGANVVSETFKVRQNRFYQLGKTYQALGTRYVENLTVRIDGTDIPATGNWDVDKAFGRLQILSGAPLIPNGSNIVVLFEWRTVRTETVNSHTRDLFGALRFIATNPTGPKRNYFFPCVRLNPRGSIDLKGDEWQQMPFDAKAMRLTPTTEQVYLDGVTFVTTTSDEQSIIDFGGITLEEFPYFEDLLNTIINVYIPSADYGAPIDYP